MITRLQDEDDDEEVDPDVGDDNDDDKIDSIMEASNNTMVHNVI